MRRSVFVLAVAACSPPGEPRATPPAIAPARAAAPNAGAAPVTGAAAPSDPAVSAETVASQLEPSSPIARWRSVPVDTEHAPSPACIVGRSDRFIQYADLDARGDPRFCLWWNLNQGAPDVGCWRINLASETYVAEGGVWFSAPQPLRVGTGGPALPSSPLAARWRDAALEICRGTACRVLAFARPPDRHDEDVALDAEGQLAVVPLADPPGAKTRSFATVELASGTRLATMQLADHGSLVVAGFLGSALIVTDCDGPERAGCVWDLYDARRGVRIAAVGGAKPLGSGGTVALVDEHHLAAVAGHTLVIQELATGKVTARLALPSPGAHRADYVVFPAPGGVLALGPDGRVVFVDPAGKITRTILPPRCSR
jgi:hypothetical protein